MIDVSTQTMGTDMLWDCSDETGVRVGRMILAAPDGLAAAHKAIQHIKQLCDIINAKPGCRVRADDFTEELRAYIAKATQP